MTMCSYGVYARYRQDKGEYGATKFLKQIYVWIHSYGKLVVLTNIMTMCSYGVYDRYRQDQGEHGTEGCGEGGAVVGDTHCTQPLLFSFFLRNLVFFTNQDVFFLTRYIRQFDSVFTFILKILHRQ